VGCQDSKGSGTKVRKVCNLVDLVVDIVNSWSLSVHVLSCSFLSVSDARGFSRSFKRILKLDRWNTRELIFYPNIKADDARLELEAKTHQTWSTLRLQMSTISEQYGLRVSSMSSNSPSAGKV